jgi:hypothetical protein
MVNELKHKKDFSNPVIPCLPARQVASERNLKKTNDKLYKNEIPKPVRDDPLITYFLFQMNFSEVSKKLIENCIRIIVPMLKVVTNDQDLVRES